MGLVFEMGEKNFKNKGETANYPHFVLYLCNAFKSHSPSGFCGNGTYRYLTIHSPVLTDTEESICNPLILIMSYTNCLWKPIKLSVRPTLGTFLASMSDGKPLFEVRVSKFISLLTGVKVVLCYKRRIPRGT